MLLKIKRSHFFILGFFCFFTFLSINTQAQNEKYNLAAVIYSGVTQKPLSYATVSLLLQKDSTHVAFGLSDKKGQVSFEGLTSNTPYNLLVYHMGYDVVRIPLNASSDQQLDTIFMMTSVKNIDELVVLAERPPLLIKNDTMEFNASAFKTLPDALVEDLLHKLPGVDKDENGNLMVNGKKVSKLLVDGKQFFGSDPAIALKNLPADAIEKVQVMTDNDKDKRNEEEDDAETVVINLTIKKGMKKGYFGKVYGGGGQELGDHNLFESGGIVNAFRDTLQVSVIGFGNNTNKQAFSFTELNQLGGFDRSGANSFWSGSSGTRIGNLNVGGATQGLNTAAGGGINVNHNLERSYLNFQYFYGTNKALVDRSNSVIQNFVDSTLTMRNQGLDSILTNSHRFGISWEMKFDTLTELDWDLNLELSSDNFNQRQSGSLASTQNVLNENYNLTKRELLSKSIDTDFYIERNSKNQKWEHWMWTSLRRNNNQTKNSQDVDIRYLDNGGYVDSTQLQRRDLDVQETVYRLYVESSYEIKDSIKINLEYSFQSDLANKLTQTFNGFDSENQAQIDELSNDMKYLGIRHRLEPSMTFIFKKFTITPGARIMYYQLTGNYGEEYGVTNINDFIVSPNLRFRMGKLYIGYSYDYSAPDADQLNPLLNRQTTYNQQSGNANLQSARSHEIRIHTNKYNTKKDIYHYLYARFNSYNNAIINSQQLLENGVRLYQPVNVNEKYQFQAGGSIKKNFKFKNKNALSLAGAGWANLSKNPNVINNKQVNFFVFNCNPNTTIEFSWKDIFVISQRFEYNYRLNRSENTEDNIGNTYTSSTVALLRWPNRFMWRSSFDFNQAVFSNQNLATNTFSLLNAEVFYDITKNKKWQANLKVYDLLNQNQSVSTYAYDNSLSFSKADVLQQYVLLSLVYNIKTYESDKVEARAKTFWW